MKKKSAVFLISSLVLLWACFTSCDNPLTNPLMGKWWDDSPSEYSVTFETNGGSPDIPGQSIKAGQLIQKPADVTKANYSFTGWYTIDGKKWDFDKDIMPKQDFTLHAVWIDSNSDIDIDDPDTYVIVTFVSNGGNDVPPQYVATGEKIIPPDIAKAGYIFVGWFTSDELRYEFDLSLPVSNQNLVLYARWLEDSSFFIVKFETNGGSPVISNQYLMLGDFINEPETISRSGYSFAGWYTVEGGLWDFENNTMPANDVTLYAVWINNDSDIDIDNPDTYIIVTFVSNGGNEVSPQFVVIGNNIIKPDITKTGYIFDGWFTTEDLRYEFNFELPVSNQNLVLYAKWIEDRTFYTVIFNTNGGTPQPHEIRVADGDVIGALPFITRAGFSLTGWFDENNKSWDIGTDPVTGSDVNDDGFLILTAKWESNDRYESGTDDFCVVIFDSNGGIPQPKAIKLAYGVAIGRLLPMTRGNDGFKGWYNEKDDKLWDVETQPVTKGDVNENGLLVLTAKWEQYISTPVPPAIYKVCFDTDSSESVIPDQLIASGSLVVQPVIPKRSGYGFDGWFFNGMLWDFNSPVTQDMTLIAGWESVFRIVRFEPNSGTRPDELTTLTHEFAISINYGIVPDPGPLVKNGYFFGGWYEDPSFAGTPWSFINNRVTSGSEPFILYARWIPQTRVIIFVPNGGGPDDKFPVINEIGIGERLTNPGAPVRTGYMFRGWFYTPSCIPGTGVDFTRYTVPAPDSIADVDPIYFYAGWIVSRLYITFNIIVTGDQTGTNNPVTGKVADQYVDYDGLVNKPNITPASGRYLDGKWYTDQALTVEWDFDKDRVTANRDLYARYRDEGWTVTFVLRNPPGGTSDYSAPDTQHIINGEKAIEPFMPPLTAPPLGINETRYSFYRWDTSTDGGVNNFTPYDFNTPVTSDITLYARWVPPVPDMVWVPRGSFIMGDAGVSGSPAAYHAYPTRRVTVDGYYISRYEITQEDGAPLTQIGTGYNQITGKTPSQFTGTRTRPVENVSWQDAMDYCNTRSARDSLTTPTYNDVTRSWQGDGYRLPTEAEWEYAAKGGYYWQDYFVYAGSENPDDVAWYNVTVKTQPSGFQTTQTVGLKLPNRLGIYDMSGNLSEWCYDWFAPYNDLRDQLINPIGGSGPYNNQNATGRVRRGGAWNNAAGNVRVSVRNSEDPAAAHWAVGFRIVRGPSVDIY